MISIIVPVYNSEKTLHRCVESLLAQTYSDLEILLVMDGSTDSSYTIGKEFEAKDSRVRILQKENGGVSKARNHGLSEASGEYVQFVDSDDYIAPYMCEMLLDSVEKAKAEIALCGYHHLFLKRDIKKVPPKGIYTLSKDKDMFLELYESGYLNMPWNKLFRRELIKTDFPEDLSLGEDLLFNLDYLKSVTKIAVVGEALYYYVQQKGQDTLSSKKRKDKYEIAVRLCDAVKESYEHILVDLSKTEKEQAIEEGNRIIHKRFILEFLDEIEGMAYDKALTKEKKLETIQRYMMDKTIQKANQDIGKLQIDYQVINYFFKRKRKYMVYLLIYLRKWVLFLIRGFH